MNYRFRPLLSPEPAAESGTESGSDAPAADVVTIARAELEDLKARAAATSATLAAESRARDEAHDRELAEAGRKAAELERSYKAAILDRELATALAGRPLVAGAASQLVKLWRDDFEVIDDGGTIRVASRDGRAVDRAVADRLGHADFAHFCLPSSRGGTGGRLPNRSSPEPSPADDAPAPRTLGEAALIRWREVARIAQPAPTGWGRPR